MSQQGRICLLELLSSSVRRCKIMTSRRKSLPRLAQALALCLCLTAQGQQPAPPQETGPFRQPELVELRKLDHTIKLDIRYATAHNFLGRAVYTEARAFLQQPAAAALVRVNKSLRKQGYGLVVFDG